MPRTHLPPRPAHPGPNASWDFVGMYRRCTGCGTYYDEDVDPGPTCRTTLPWPLADAPMPAPAGPLEAPPEGRFARTDPDDLPRVWWREHDLARVQADRATVTATPAPTRPSTPRRRSR